MKLLLFIGLFLVFLFLFILSDPQPYKFIMLFGGKGCGKTLYLQKLAIKFSNKGYQVYSNVKLFRSRLFDINDFGFGRFECNPGQDVVLLLDEMSLEWFNRDFKSFKREVREQLVYQRHCHLIIYCCSQSFNIDKAARDLCDELYLCSKHGKISILKKIIKHPDLKTSQNNDGSGSDADNFITDGYRYDFIFAWHWTYLPRYYKFYDSFNYKPIYDAKKPIKYVNPRFVNEYYLSQIIEPKNYFKFEIWTPFYESVVNYIEPRFQLAAGFLAAKMKRGWQIGRSAGISIDYLWFFDLV